MEVIILKNYWLVSVIYDRLKVFWRKVLDIYATSIGYDDKLEISIQFFETVQNKMHWAAHGHTAAEIIYRRIDEKSQTLG